MKDFLRKLHEAGLLRGLYIVAGVFFTFLVALPALARNQPKNVGVSVKDAPTNGTTLSLDTPGLPFYAYLQSKTSVGVTDNTVHTALTFGSTSRVGTVELYNGAEKLLTVSDSNAAPGHDLTLDLGTAAYRWKTVYAENVQAKTINGDEPLTRWDCCFIMMASTLLGSAFVELFKLLRKLLYVRKTRRYIEEQEAKADPKSRVDA